MIRDKRDILQMLREEFDRWEELLADMSEEQIIDPKLPSHLSVKDVIAHLWSWQQISMARMEAGLWGKTPEYPHWLDGFDPDSEDDLEAINASIHNINEDKHWSTVYTDWSKGFLKFMEMAEAAPEKDLLDVERYSWLNGYSLADVLLGSYDHHHEEHLEPLLAWLRQNENKKFTG